MAVIFEVRVLKTVAKVYISFIRGTPTMVQLVLVYYGIPILLRVMNEAWGTSFDINGIHPVVFAIITLGLNAAAYMSEIIRSALMSVDEGQVEACYSLNMTKWQALISVVIPQAFCTRSIFSGGRPVLIYGKKEWDATEAPRRRVWIRFRQSRRLVGSLQEIVSRRISPTETAVISVTRFTSGTSWNIIPETARLEGTVRTFNPKVREQIVKLMQAQAEGLEQEGYQVEFTWIPGCPATNNDANLAELVRKEAMEEGFHVTLRHPEMGGEDFSCYQELVPGAFFHVGNGGKYPAHNSKFTVDPAALFGASKLMSEIVKKALKAS